MGMTIETVATSPDYMNGVESPRRVYCLVGVPPEIQAYAMAKYSRSSQGMLESVRELSGQAAEKFLDTFYFQYGHRSIADLAHLVVALENISILAAIRVVDEPLWDGQERSTRYQNFRQSGYETPAGLSDPARAAATWRAFSTRRPQARSTWSIFSAPTRST